MQLSMYVPRAAAAPLEAVRQVLDPVQHRLIPAHVTLCREDELRGLRREDLALRASGFLAQSVELRFGPPVSFDGHGILLPCVSGELEFRELREHVLGTTHVRRQAPHITLAHPRNPKAPGNDLATARTLPPDLAFRFTSVTLIRQEGGGPWQVLDELRLAGLVARREK